MLLSNKPFPENVIKPTILLLFSICWGLQGCGDSYQSKTTQTSSDQFDNISDKVKFLEKYVHFRRTYQSLEFTINYHDNSGGFLAGPSDWDIRIIAKVPTAELSQWSKGLQPTSLQELPVSSNIINYAGEFEWLRNGALIVGIDHKNAIAVYSHSTGAQVN